MIMEDIQRDITLKDYTSYKVGGPAEYFFIAKNIEELKRALVWAKDKGLKTTILGGGSNVVISDKGLMGLVIVNKSHDIDIEGNSVRADSGVLLKALVNKVLESGKGGIEFLANIPGTVGGAVAVNAGCYRKFAADFLISATIFHSRASDGNTLKVAEQSGDSFRVEEEWMNGCIEEVGKDSSSVTKWNREEENVKLGGLSIPLHQVTGGQVKSSNKPMFCVEKVKNDFFEFKYRSSKIKRGYEAIVLDATFEINDTDMGESRKFITEDRERRDMKHPTEPSCGSYFKNPSKENIAGELIEKSGIKGYQIGGAQVSEKHANFIINTGEANASDIKNLANYIKKIVKEKTGLELEEEVKYLGEFE
ncbi:hypothetical protein COY62_03345 [bacterium (Candidatus Howlettbacteria) CG_4_10_14_0_8_um_filter_40_9]|nr:MAG: hypothetical protein COY62_03345 [bacterium (Candidatus Howlettbacteria) CG_4_10_14_0_8_um_filter_40_9]